MHPATGSLLERERSAQRAQLLCLGVSAVLHLLLFITLPAPSRWTEPWTAPHIGFEGPELYLGEVNPQDRRIEEQEMLAAARVAAGALVDEEVPLPSEEEKREAIRKHLEKGFGERGEPSPPVIELGEDWSLRSTSEPSSRSSQFVIVKMVRPEYPVDAILHGIEGVVRVQAWIDTEGKVTNVRILDSEVDPGCELETTRAMWLWRFRPYRVAGRAVTFSVIVPFRFRLT